MGKTDEDFVLDLKKMEEFIKDKKQVPVLAERAGVTTATVYNTFKETSFDNLSGDRLKVYTEAIVLIEEIKSLPSKAQKVINS